MSADAVGAQIGDHCAETVFLTEHKKQEMPPAGSCVRSGGTPDAQLEHLELERERRDGLAGRESGRERSPSDPDLPSHAPPLGREDVFLDFPVTIDIHDASTIANNTLTTYGSVQSVIERNKSLCAAAGGKHLLTIEEEERIVELLREEDGEAEKYGFVHAKGEEREAELDSLLLGLGYDVDDDDEEDVDATTMSASTSGGLGEPVLCALAKERALDEHARQVDRALFALLREPLLPVVRIPEDGTDEGGASLPPAGRGGESCGGETTLSAATTEAELKALIRKVKDELEEDDLMLADDGSIRGLAQSLLGRPQGTLGRVLGEAAAGIGSGSVMLLLKREIHR